MTKPNADSTPLLPASDLGSTAAWGSKDKLLRPSPAVSDPDWIPFDTLKLKLNFCGIFFQVLSYY